MEGNAKGKTFKLKGHTLPGINQKSEGDTDLPDGRSASSAFQYKSPAKHYVDDTPEHQTTYGADHTAQTPEEHEALVTSAAGGKTTTSKKGVESHEDKITRLSDKYPNLSKDEIKKKLKTPRPH